MKINAPLIFGGTAIMHFIMVAAISAVVSDKGMLNGLVLGICVAIFWVLPAMKVRLGIFLVLRAP